MPATLSVSTLIEQFYRASQDHSRLVIQRSPDGHISIHAATGTDGNEWESLSVLATQLLAEHGVSLPRAINWVGDETDRAWVEGMVEAVPFTRWLLDRVPLVRDPFAPMPDWDRVRGNPFVAAARALEHAQAARGRDAAVIPPVTVDAEESMRRVAAAIGDNTAAQILSIAQDRTKTVDQKQRAIVIINPTAVAWDGARWAQLLECTGTAARKTDWWMSDRKRLRADGAM